MKKLAAFCLALFMGFSAFATDSSDVVVLVDTSQSVSSYFDKIVEYIVTRVANDYLLQGDTFHLLTFSDTSQLELSQEIQNEASIQNLVARLYLLAPFGKKTDILSALNYLDQYVSDLGDRNSKRIIIITDGVNDPPSGSPYAGMSQEAVLKAIDETTARLTARGWNISLIRVPFTDTGDGSDPLVAKAHSEAFIGQLSTGLRSPAVVFDPDHPEKVARESLGLPIATYPGDLGKRPESFTFPVKIENTSLSKLRLELREVASSGRDILDKPSFLILGPGASGDLKVKVNVPSEVKNGPVQLPVKLLFADSQRVSPTGTTLSFTLARNPLSTFFHSSLTVVVFIIMVVAAFALIAIIIWILAGMSGMSTAPVVRAVAGSAEAQAPAAAAKRGRKEAPAPAPAVAKVAHGPELSPSARLAVTAATKEKPEELSPSAKLALKAKEEAAKAPALPETRRVKSDEYAIPLSLKEKIVRVKVPSKARLEAEKRRAERAAASEARKREAQFASSLKPRKEASIHVQMIVEEQNPNIGLRNIHTMKAGTTLTLGGSRFSDFLIFVVKVPSKIASVYFDGDKLVFLPIRKDVFPGLEGPLEDCIGSSISAVSPSGFKMTIRFELWKNPSERAVPVLKAF